jgi:hypothetical protein
MNAASVREFARTHGMELRHPLSETLWQEMRVAARSRFMWSAVAATLFCLLLLSFYGQLRQAAERREVQRQAATAQANALWRCRALPAADLRRSCEAEMTSRIVAAQRVPANAAPVRLAGLER